MYSDVVDHGSVILALGIPGGWLGCVHGQGMKGDECWHCAASFTMEWLPAQEVGPPYVEWVFSSQ